MPAASALVGRIWIFLLQDLEEVGVLTIDSQVNRTSDRPLFKVKWKKLPPDLPFQIGLMVLLHQHYLSTKKVFWQGAKEPLVTVKNS